MLRDAIAGSPGTPPWLHTLPWFPPADARQVTPAIPWRRLAGWFGLSRLVILIAAVVSPYCLKPGPFFHPPRSMLDWLIWWDAGWFRDLIEKGYEFHPDRMSNVNFLPMYPWLVRSLSWLIPVEVAGILVTNVAALIAAGLLWRITERIRGDPAAADGAALFFVFGPVNVFFCTLYSEATFLLFALGAVLAAHRQRWLWAGAAAAAATLSRSVGLLLIVPLAVMFLQQHARLAAWRRPKTWANFAACGLPLVAALGFTAYLGWRFHEPQAYLISHHHAGHVRSFFWQLFTTYHFRTLPTFYQLWFGAAVLGGLLLLLAGTLLRLPIAFTLFSLAMCLLYFSMKSLEGMPRFLSIVFPFYCTLGYVWSRWRWPAMALLAASIGISAFSAALFVNGYWFT